MHTDQSQAKAAANFARQWKGRGYERGEAQLFWIELLTQVFGVKEPSSFIRFEEQVKVDTTNFIDAHIPSTRVLIEQKSLDKDPRHPIAQSNGTHLTPFEQARRYVLGLPLSAHPRWIVVCNFREFLVYDMERPNAEPESILLENLGREYYRLSFLVDSRSEALRRELEVSVEAGNIIGAIYDALVAAPPATMSQAGYLHALNTFCVRLVFCFYAEDAGVFRRNQFHDYLIRFHSQDFRQALIQLFDVLATPPERRDPFLEPALAAFPYVNGGLFASGSAAPGSAGASPAPIAASAAKVSGEVPTKAMTLDAGEAPAFPGGQTPTRDAGEAPALPAFPAHRILIPPISLRAKTLILERASAEFDWSEISPTIFGAVFESTLNPETRRAGGMHYTAIENIHRVIDPLFLNDLRSEFAQILSEKVERKRRRQLDAFQERLASLRFLDPACGSGNFLTETYLSLRRLENEVIRERYRGQAFLGFEEVNPIKVSIHQFFGIEVNDFAVTVAKTALWISEAQMLAETERIISRDLDFLPLKTYTNILEANALQTAWPKADYVIGNPPFVGARMMTAEQKQDVIDIFGKKWKNVGNLDYVCCWYKKAADLMQAHPLTRTAFVSTNSITQGEQVAALWKALPISILFAHRTFRWDSEASLKAHVHCVIIGFGAALTGYAGVSPATIAASAAKECGEASAGAPISAGETPAYPVIFDGDKAMPARHINAYLMDAPDVFVESRKTALCEVPQMVYGSKPTEGGNLFITSAERDEILRREPGLQPFIRPTMGAEEFIKGKARYVLWLKEATPSTISHSPELRRRVEAVRAMRLASPKEATRQCAQTPWLFQEDRQPPSGHYLLVPRVSSERRRYVPIGFMSANVIASDAVQIIPHATLYHFGVLTSSVHMAWMRAVCGRLETRYRYSKDVVYNNFPWPHRSAGIPGSAGASPAQGNGAALTGYAGVSPATIAASAAKECGEASAGAPISAGETPAYPVKAAALPGGIAATAQAILDARALYPDSSLADLYDELTMPPELRRAHAANDRAVLAAYGLPPNATDDEILTHLFTMYRELTSQPLSPPPEQ